MLSCASVLPGSLWDELLASLESGSVVVCHSKAPQTEEPKGPSGLLKNRYYSIMDARKVFHGCTEGFSSWILMMRSRGPSDGSIPVYHAPKDGSAMHGIDIGRLLPLLLALDSLSPC